MFMVDPFLVFSQIFLNFVIGVLFMIAALVVVPRYYDKFSGVYDLVFTVLAAASAGFFHLQLAYFLWASPEGTNGGFQFTYAGLFMNIQMSVALLLLNGLVVVKVLKGRRKNDSS